MNPITRARRLVKVINRIIRNPDSWSQKEYHGLAAYYRKVHCFAGHADIEGGFWNEKKHRVADATAIWIKTLEKRNATDQFLIYKSTPGRARAWLGLTFEESEWAFATDRNFTELYRFVLKKIEHPAPLTLTQLYELSVCRFQPIQPPTAYQPISIGVVAYFRLFMAWNRGIQ